MQHQMYLDSKEMSGPDIITEPLICKKCKELYIQKSTDKIKNGVCSLCQKKVLS